MVGVSVAPAAKRQGAGIIREVLMPKLNVDATELVGTDVNFVSLVKRGANRIPFRIVKEDESMLDLHKIGRTLFKKSDPAPQIVGAMISKTADVSKIAAVFKASGLDPQNFQKSEHDDFIMVGIPGLSDLEGTSVVKMNDDFSLVVTGLQKGFKDWDFNASSFAEVLKVQGHYMSMVNAMDAFRTTANNALYEADTPSEAAQSISKAADEFKNYLVSLTSALPEHAFKMEVELLKSNGTGEGFEAGKGTGTSQSATEDDKQNTILKDDDPCWDGYEMVGFKNKNGKQVPNCVPVEKGSYKKKKPDHDEEHDMEKGYGKPKDKDKMKKDEGEPVQKRQGMTEADVPQPKGHEPGDSPNFATAPTESEAARRRATADDAANTTENGGVSGSSIPDGDTGLGRVGGVKKNEGDGHIGQSGHGNQLPDDKSGAGAQMHSPDEFKVIKDELAQLTSLMTGLVKSVEGVSGLSDSVRDLGKRVDQVAEMARKTDEALNGTVFNDTAGDSQTRVSKSEAAGAPPLLDTAYVGRVA